MSEHHSSQQANPPGDSCSGEKRDRCNYARGREYQAERGEIQIVPKEEVEGKNALTNETAPKSVHGKQG